MLSELVARVDVGEIWVITKKAAGGDLLRDIHGLKASGVGRVTEPRSVHAVTIRAHAEMVTMECWVHACQSPNRECRNS